jgi:hypothetical protein
MRVELNCSHCGESFTKPPCLVGPKNNFCSRACSDKGRSRENLKNLGKSPEERQQRSNYMKKAWAEGLRNNDALVQEAKSSEGRKRRSENLLQQYRDGTRLVPIKSGHYSIKTVYRDIVMRSKLEARYAKSLDDQGIIWLYEPNRFWLEELQCSYIPDFYLVESDTYIEVKGWEQGLEKVEAFRSMGYNIEIVRDGEIE